MDYNFTCDIGRCKIKFRPWLVKDKFAIKDAKTIYDKRKALVYNCLETPDIALDINEFQYVLFCIRNASVDYVTEYNVVCDHCQKEYVVDVNFKDVLIPIFADYSPIMTKNYTFELQEVKNQQFYEEVMQNISDSERRTLLDFIMHVKSINDDYSLDATQIFKIINNMNTSEFEELLTAWEKKHFRFTLEAKAKCPHCSEFSAYRFTAVDNFFPKSWSKII